MKVDFPALFRPSQSVRHTPVLVCGMLRPECAAYSGFTVRHAPVYACHRLAEKLGIVDPQELEYIQWGALLHDIGKLAIPYEILRKEGELSQEEWDIIKSHPDLAQELLGNIDYIKPALSIARSHHENWDGTGYPQKLMGEQIPLHARLFSVVVNWDALTTDRPYRKAWSPEKTINYLREQSGKKFDPEIVDVFITKVARAS